MKAFACKYTVSQYYPFSKLSMMGFHEKGWLIMNIEEEAELKDKKILVGTLEDLMEQMISSSPSPIKIELSAPLTEFVIKSIQDAFLSFEWPPGSRIVLNEGALTHITLDLLKKFLGIFRSAPPNFKLHFMQTWGELMNEFDESCFSASESLVLLEEALLTIPPNFTLGINRNQCRGAFDIDDYLSLAKIIKKITSPGFVLELTENSSSYDCMEDDEKEVKEHFAEHIDGPACMLIKAALSNPYVIGLNIQMAVLEVGSLMQLLAKNTRSDFQLNVSLDNYTLLHESTRVCEIHINNLLSLLIYAQGLHYLRIDSGDGDSMTALNINLAQAKKLLSVLPNNKELKQVRLDLDQSQQKEIMNFCRDILVVRPDAQIDDFTYKNLLQQIASDHKLPSTSLESDALRCVLSGYMQENPTIKKFHFFSLMRRRPVDDKESSLARLALSGEIINNIYSFMAEEKDFAPQRFYVDCQVDRRLSDALGYLAVLYCRFPQYLIDYQARLLDGLSVKAMLITCFFKSLNITVKKDQVVLDALKHLFPVGEWALAPMETKNYILKFPSSSPSVILRKMADVFNHCFLDMAATCLPRGSLYLTNVTILSLMAGYCLHRQTLKDFIATTASVVTSPVPTPPPSSTAQASGMDVPADGNCFYWSVALACLLEARLDRIRFNQMYQRLFGEVKAGDVGSSLPTSSEIKRNHVYSKLSATSLNLKDIFKDPVISSLVCSVFRKRVIDQAARSFNDPQRLIAAQAYGRVSWEEYAKVAEQPGTFAGHTELILASHVLNRKLMIYSNGRCYQVGEAKAEGSEIKLCHVNAQGRQNGALNHFRLMMDEKLIMAPPTTAQPIRSVGVSAPSASGSMIFMPSQSSKDKDKIKGKRKALASSKKPSNDLNNIFQ